MRGTARDGTGPPRRDGKVVRNVDPVTLVVGAAIGLAGVFVGRMLPRRETDRRRSLPEQHPPPQSRTPQPVCGCGHHLVFHDQQNKLCQAQVIIPGRWTGQHAGTYAQCKCQGYRGPVPVDEYYAPDLLEGNGG